MPLEPRLVAVGDKIIQVFESDAVNQNLLLMKAIETLTPSECVSVLANYADKIFTSWNTKKSPYALFWLLKMSDYFLPAHLDKLTCYLKLYTYIKTDNVKKRDEDRGLTARQSLNKAILEKDADGKLGLSYLFLAITHCPNAELMDFMYCLDPECLNMVMPELMRVFCSKVPTEKLKRAFDALHIAYISVAYMQNFMSSDEMLRRAKEPKPSLEKIQRDLLAADPAGNTPLDLAALLGPAHYAACVAFLTQEKKTIIAPEIIEELKLAPNKGGATVKAAAPDSPIATTVSADPTNATNTNNSITPEIAEKENIADAANTSVNDGNTYTGVIKFLGKHNTIALEQRRATPSQQNIQIPSESAGENPDLMTELLGHGMRTRRRKSNAATPKANSAAASRVATPEAISAATSVHAQTSNQSGIRFITVHSSPTLQQKYLSILAILESNTVDQNHLLMETVKDISSDDIVSIISVYSAQIFNSWNKMKNPSGLFWLLKMMHHFFHNPEAKPERGDETTLLCYFRLKDYLLQPGKDGNIAKASFQKATILSKDSENNLGLSYLFLAIAQCSNLKLMDLIYCLEPEYLQLVIPELMRVFCSQVPTNKLERAFDALYIMCNSVAYKKKLQMPLMRKGAHPPNIPHDTIDKPSLEEIQDDLFATDSVGNTPLHLAAMLGPAHYAACVTILTRQKKPIISLEIIKKLELARNKNGKTVPDLLAEVPLPQPHGKFTPTAIARAPVFKAPAVRTVTPAIPVSTDRLRRTEFGKENGQEAANTSNIQKLKF